jgi:hypothetical protein
VTSSGANSRRAALRAPRAFLWHSASSAAHDHARSSARTVSGATSESAAKSTIRGKRPSGEDDRQPQRFVTRIRELLTATD